MTCRISGSIVRWAILRPILEYPLERIVYGAKWWRNVAFSTFVATLCWNTSRSRKSQAPSPGEGGLSHSALANRTRQWTPRLQPRMLLCLLLKNNRLTVLRETVGRLFFNFTYHLLIFRFYLAVTWHTSRTTARETVSVTDSLRLVRPLCTEHRVSKWFKYRSHQKKNPLMVVNAVFYLYTVSSMVAYSK